MSNNRKNSNKTNKRIKADKKEKSDIASVDEANKSKLDTNGSILDSAKSDNEKEN